MSLFVAAPLVEEDKKTDEGNFLLWRLEKGVAEGSAEIPKGIAPLGTCKFCVPCKRITCMFGYAIVIFYALHV